MRAADLIKKSRKLVNPPYSTYKVLILLGCLIILLAIPLTVLLVKEAREPATSAKSEGSIPTPPNLGHRLTFLFQEETGKLILKSKIKTGVLPQKPSKPSGESEVISFKVTFSSQDGKIYKNWVSVKKSFAYLSKNTQELKFTVDIPSTRGNLNISNRGGKSVFTGELK